MGPCVVFADGILSNAAVYGERKIRTPLWRLPVKHIFRFVASALTVVVIANGALPARSTSSTDGATEQVVASERAWAKAAADDNAAKMAGLMADDYVEIAMETDPGTKNSRWVTTDKAEWVNLVRSGREKYQSVELRNLKVYFHADIATVSGEYSQTATKDGKDISESGVYVDTWVRKNGKWQVVSSVFP
jgi:ketosteroid isomerase-like protein